MNRSLLIILFLSLLTVSCKKEKTNWSTDWNAPLVHGTLTINDLIPADYTQTNSDNYLSIVYNERAFTLNLDSIVEFPDTNIVQKTALGFGITINPGFVWANSADQIYDLGGIELKQVQVKEGDLTFVLRSEWGGKTKMIMDFPKVSLQGVPHYKEYFLDSGSVANPTVEYDSIDMAGYWLDLTGVDGNQYNTLSGDFIVESNEIVNTYDVSVNDSLEYEIIFKDVILDYAKGFFGTHTLQDTIGISLPFMNSIIGGTIDVDSIDMTVNFKNGFNLIAQAELSLLKGVNSNSGGSVDLSFPQIGQTLNINPATGSLWGYTPSEYPLTVNNTNSNIASFIENLPDSLYVGYDIAINPFGNTTAGSDEVFPGSSIDVWVNGEFPIDLGMNNLTLTDTFNLSYTGSSSYTGEGAIITLDYTNGFPLGANASLYLLDDNNSLISTITGSSAILSGTYNTGTYQTSPNTGQVIFNLDHGQILDLEQATQIAVVVSFTTDMGQKVKIDANAAFDFNLRSNLQLGIHL